MIPRRLESLFPSGSILRGVVVSRGCISRALGDGAAVLVCKPEALVTVY
jgi:hypothetical protein